MKPKEFVESTWLDYSDVTSDCVLMDLNAYIKFQFLNHITKEVMAEKLYDHFMMVELMNTCDFNKLIKSYFKCLNEIIVHNQHFFSFFNLVFTRNNNF